MDYKKLVSLFIIICAIFGFSLSAQAIAPEEMAASILSSDSNWEAKVFGTASIANSLSSEQVFEKVKKSTVRVVTLYEGDVIMPKPVYNQSKGIYEPGKDTVQKYVGTYALGTGFVISSDGYIATCAHVVDKSMSTATENLWYQFQDNIYYDLAEQFLDMSDADLEDLYYKMIDYVSEYSDIDNVTYDISVLNPDNYDKDFDTQFDSGYKADVRKFGNPYPEYGKDLAIIKIEASGLTPVAIGDSEDVKPGNKIYVIGYPVIADLDDQTMNIPSLTGGVVSAIKPSSLGNYNVIQIDAAVKGGNSGGPVANEKGQVVGIATFSAVDSDSYNWILPVNLLRDYINELNIKTENAEEDSSMSGYIMLGVWSLVVFGLGAAVAFLIFFLINKRKPRQLGTNPAF